MLSAFGYSAPRTGGDLDYLHAVDLVPAVHEVLRRICT